MKGFLNLAVLAIVLAGPAPMSVAAPRAAPEAAVEGPPADLVVANRHVVTLRHSFGAFTPALRVAGAMDRVRALDPADLERPVTSKQIAVGGLPGYAIEINDKYLIGIFAGDVDPVAGEKLEDVTRTAVERLDTARVAYLELHAGSFMAKQASIATTAVAIFVLAWYLLARLRAQVRTWVSGVVARRIGHMSPRGLDLANVALRIASAVLIAIYYAAVAFGAYVCLTISLSRFTYTRPWGERLKGWLFDLAAELVHGVAGALPGLFAAFVIFMLAWLATRALSGLLARVERGEIDLLWVYADTAPASRSIATVLIWLFALTVAFPYLPGSDSEVFKGVSLFAGLMVTLGSSGIVGQWMAGMTLIYSRAMRPGDLIKAGENEGVVTAIGLLSTKIQTATGEEITLPNSSILGGSIRNFTRLAGGAGSRVSTTVTIGYDAPWRQVHAMLLEAAARTPGLRTEPPPFVLQRALNDFYVEYELVGRIDVPLERPYVMTSLHGNVQDVFNEHGVQILSPHFMMQPAEPVVVDKRNWYAPPAKPD